MWKPLAAAAAAAILVTASAQARAQTTTLRGTVGPGFRITLTKNGKRVTSVPGGTYRIVVSDRSPIHNFVLERSHGGGERRLTTVPFTGTKTVTLKLTRGEWEFYCAPHESTMHGDLRVR